MAVIATSVRFWWQTRAAATTSPDVAGQNLPTVPQPLDETPVLGNAKARIAIIEYSDFQCPYCGSFVHDTWPDLKKRYVDTGQVLLAFKHLPLPNHPFARSAAISANCARLQGRFWEMHDGLFDRQQELNVSTGNSIARTLHLQDTTFSQCLQQRADIVERDLASARELRINGTPTFLVGTVDSGRRVRVTHVITGTRPLDEFVRAIDEAGRIQPLRWWHRVLRS